MSAKARAAERTRIRALTGPEAARTVPAPMAVHIRLTRQGSKKKPFYRIVVTDHRSPREGRFLELIGTYDPSKDPGLFTVDSERLAYWTKNGATRSRT